jgi:hypothetical protein
MWKANSQLHNTENKQRQLAHAQEEEKELSKVRE